MAHIKVQPAPNGEDEFVFVSTDGGHGDVIGNGNAFDEFLRQAFELGLKEHVLFCREIHMQQEAMSLREVSPGSAVA